MTVDLSRLNLLVAAPEIFLLCLICVVLLLDLFFDEERRPITYILTLCGLAVTAALQIYLMQLPENPVAAFNGLFVNDAIAQLAKLVMYAAVFFLLVYSRRYVALRDLFKGEYYVLILFALLGMCIMVSTTHFIALYLGLELLSLSLYALIALRRHDIAATEAALKYFVLGSLASGVLLYGISMIYGGSGGQLSLPGVITVLLQSPEPPILVQLGLIFVVAGIAFKLGTVPFHMWVPDVYHGAPTAVAAFTGSAPKIAATVFAYRILVEGLRLNFAEWSGLLIILAVASLLVGNLAAIMQTNIKRMLAYSTISHMGFVLLAFVGNALTPEAAQDLSFSGLSAALYYVLTYVLMSLVAFGILLALSNQKHECENISDLAGLNRSHPWYAFLMLLAMFSMAGIPPLMGFYAKFYVIMAMLEQGYIALAVYAVIMSLIGAFYYLRIVKTMYFDTPEIPQSPVDFTFSARCLLTVNALVLIVFGVFPSWVLDWCVALFHF